MIISEILRENKVDLSLEIFGEVAIKRNWYKAPEDSAGRFPLDTALGLVDGYTPALAGLI